MYDQTKGRGMTDQDNGNQGTNGAEWIAVGMTIGVAVGTALGTAIDNIGMGIALGIALGVALGAAIMSTKQREGKGDETS